jgi:hypothetical protein
MEQESDRSVLNGREDRKVYIARYREISCVTPYEQFILNLRDVDSVMG